MKIFGTSFSLTLGSWRLRIRIDLDDDPEDRTLALHEVHARGRADRTAISR
jgi:hypothetical protein